VQHQRGLVVDVVAGALAGVGEELDSLAPFDPQAYVEWLLAA